jgi:hypothetical protein
VAGPFIDLDGRRLFVDVFEAGKLTPITPKGQAAPLMLVSGGSARRTHDQVSIGIAAAAASGTAIAAPRPASPVGS